jgi:hypothetical protein
VPVVYYEGTLSGTSLVDISGNNNNGYTTNAAQGTNQNGPNYISLSGSSSKIDISNNAQTNISSPISIEFIRSINTFSESGALVSKYNNGLGWYLSCSSSSPHNNVRFGAGLNNGNLQSTDSNVDLVAGQVPYYSNL